MMSKVFIGFALLAAAIAQSVDNHNEFMEEVFASPESLPYPYQNHVLMKRLADHKPEQRTLYDPSYLVVPAVVAKDVALTNIGLVATVATKLFAVGKFIALFAISHLPKLLIGAVIAIGVCKLTPLCSKVSSSNVLEDIRYYATPERVARASEFLEKAVQKYSEMKDSADRE